MSGKRHSEEEIVRVLREAEVPGVTAQEVCRKHGITEPTFYRWKKRFGAMGVDETKRLKQLEAENQRLKKLLADRTLEIDAMQEVLAKRW